MTGHRAGCLGANTPPGPGTHCRPVMELWGHTGRHWEAREVPACPAVAVPPAGGPLAIVGGLCPWARVWGGCAPRPGVWHLPSHPEDTGGGHWCQLSPAAVGGRHVVVGTFLPPGCRLSPLCGVTPPSSPSPCLTPPARHQNSCCKFLPSPIATSGLGWGVGVGLPRGVGTFGGTGRCRGGHGVPKAPGAVG